MRPTYELAEKIARAIFKTGEWNDEKAERMAYKFGKHPEREGGGLCESAMASIILRALNSSGTTSEKQT